MDAQNEAGRALLPDLIDVSIDTAHQLVAAAAARVGVRLTLRILRPDARIAPKFQFGRISVTVRDDIVETATLG